MYLLKKYLFGIALFCAFGCLTFAYNSPTYGALPAVSTEIAHQGGGGGGGHWGGGGGGGRGGWGHGGWDRGDRWNDNSNFYYDGGIYGYGAYPYYYYNDNSASPYYYYNQPYDNGGAYIGW